MTILYAEEDKIDSNLLLEASQLMRESSSRSLSIFSEATTEIELKAIIEEKNRELEEHKKAIAELIQYVKTQKKKIMKLKQQSKEPSVDETKSEYEEVKQISKGKEELCGLAIEFGTIIDLIDTDKNIPAFISDLAPSYSTVKQQLDKRFDEYNELIIDMSKEDDIKFISVLKYFKLPKLNRINLYCLDENNTDIVKLMTNSFPDQLKQFSFNYNSKTLSI